MFQEAMKIQFVIPIYNEQDCLPEMIQRLQSLAVTMGSDVNLEFIFVNDGSRDRTLPFLLEFAEKYDNIQVIDLARNFGHQLALSAGLDQADADFVIIIDGDLQDPPEALIPMLKLAQEGADIVYGQRSERVGESHFKKLTAHLFYRLIVKLCNVDIPRDTGDFRLINRKVLLAFKGFKERHRFIRGMVPWLGFKSVAYTYKRDVRYAGETKFPFRKMLSFALDAIFSFSNSPLRLATYVGLFLVACGFALATYMMYLKLFLNTPAPGITTILLVLFFLGGFQILMLGLIGEYIGRIFEEVKGRPLYVINHIYKK